MLTYKELKQRITIEQVLKHYRLRMTRNKKGDQYVAECPFCTGVFKASYEKNCFKCFSCDAQGNILDFVAKKEQLSIRDAALVLYNQFVEKQPTVLSRFKALFTRA